MSECRHQWYVMSPCPYCLEAEHAAALAAQKDRVLDLLRTHQASARLHRLLSQERALADAIADVEAMK
jgi:hypothetical protein